MELNSNHNNIKIKIDNNDYFVALHLSFGDVIVIVENVFSLNCDYKKIVATIIEKHIIEKPAEISLVQQIANNEDLLNAYINALVQEEKTLARYFDKYEHLEDLSQKFVLAVNDKYQEESKALSEKLKESLSTAQQIRTQVLGNIVKTTNALAKVLEPYLRISKKISEGLLEVGQQIASVFAKIKIPAISEDEKQELCDSFEIWGTYGWTIIPQGEIFLYRDPPSSQKEANEIAMSYMNKDEVLKLFEDTMEMDGVKKNDFNEAIIDYKNKQYKSCILILFSLIDAKLIRMQRKDEYNKKRPSGKSAINNIANRIEKETDINKKLFLMLSFKNLFACLNVFFANGDDFKKQPELANRNFICHGMLNKSVRKRDCIQLFLLYHNFLGFFNYINNK